jgi:hypothetical protein
MLQYRSKSLLAVHAALNYSNCGYRHRIAIEEDLAMRAQREYYDVLAGNARDEIVVTYTGQDLLLRPIFIENDDGERDVLCYVPQNLQVHENEPFTRMVCDILRAGMREAFPSEEKSPSDLSDCLGLS